MAAKSVHKWQQDIERAALAPDGAPMTRLLRQVRKKGVYALGFSQAPEAAQHVLRRHGVSLSPTVVYLLTRLRDAGMACNYHYYVGVGILSSGLAPREAPQAVYALVNSLLSLEELQNHDQRPRLEKGAERVLDLCRHLAFSSKSLAPRTRRSIEMTLLPESSEADELIFLAVVQATELIFYAVGGLSDEALEAINHNHMGGATAAVHDIVRMETLLTPLLGVLSSISIPSWYKFRDFIALPGGRQSVNFRGSVANLRELHRVQDHPRLPDFEEPLRAVFKTRLDCARQAFQKWNDAHLQIARKYGKGSDDPSVAWLHSQQPVI